MFCEGFERSQKRTGTVGQAHGDGHFARLGVRRFGRAGRTQQDKAGEIFGVVLNTGEENDAAVMRCGAEAGDGRATFIGVGNSFAHASGGVLRGDTLELRMCGEKTLALGKSHGMGSDGAEIAERRAGAADEMMPDREDRFGGDGESAFEKEVVDADDGSGERVFDRSQESVREAIADGAKCGIESEAWNCGDSLAKKLDCGFFAEGAGFTLKRNAHFMDDSTAQHGQGVLRAQ